MAENLVICIARQFGSGGHEVGRALAKELGLVFYDKELLGKAAEKSGILHEMFEKNDERAIGSLLGALPGAGQKVPTYADYAGFLPGEHVQDVIADVIRDAAQQSSCVIIGRCADYILRGQPRMLSVFLHAPLETRIQRIARLHNLDEDKARALIRKTDHTRANYYSFYTDRQWDDINNYNISLDIGRLGTQKSVQLITQAASLFAPA